MVRVDGDGDRRVLVCNPVSGSEDHVDRVVELAGEHGFEVRTSERAGHAEELAHEVATDGAALVAAAGGDGTINEVVNGLVAADALEETTLGVVPVGTGNNFASNVGIDDLEHAFEVIDSGERRTIDVGITNERVFVNSCISGITAEASGATSSSSKSRFGVLAYVLQTLETVTDFESVPLCVEMDGNDRWEGEAMFALVGNCRRFTTARRAQANVEDGCFEVTIVERAPTVDLVSEAALDGLLDRETDHIVRRRTPSLSVEHRDGELVEYSLDGEMLTAETLSMATRERALTVAVGERYRPNPDDDHVSESTADTNVKPGQNAKAESDPNAPADPETS